MISGGKGNLMTTENEWIEWAGGDSAPADWDGGPVMHRDGSIVRIGVGADWSSTIDDELDQPLGSDIIAYHRVQS